MRLKTGISILIYFVNVDIIARNELGGYTEENFVKAAEIARERIAGHLEIKQDFMIESNLAKTADYNWIDNMKKAGYEIILYFLCTRDILVNIERVERRVKEGGHFIPAHIVTDRYNLSLIYLKSRLNLFKEVCLIDNTEQVVEEMAILNNGEILMEIEGSPDWVVNLLFIVKKLRR